MRYLNQSAIYQSGASTIVYPTFYMTSPWILLVLAWLLTVLLVYLFFVPSAVVYALITVVYVAIGLLHQNWMIDFATVFRWPLLLMCILLLWLHKKLFFNFINLALPVWFISGGLAVGIMALGHFEFEFVRSLPLYFLWAGVQQVLIGPVFSAQIQHHFKTPQLMTACLVGVLFSIIHTPNHLLMVVTLISGIAWSYAWLKYENIYANAFSHALLALVFYQSIPNKWFGSARIGVFF
jgi:membrane protease YdiL (CAAX protease family)